MFLKRDTGNGIGARYIHAKLQLLSRGPVNHAAWAFKFPPSLSCVFVLFESLSKGFGDNITTHFFWFCSGSGGRRL
jgi:hypothetical protein